MTEPLPIWTLAAAAAAAGIGLAVGVALWRLFALVRRAEDRLSDELERTRGALEAAIRDGTQAALRGQGESAFGLSSRLDAVRAGLQESVATRLQELQRASGTLEVRLLEAANAQVEQGARTGSELRDRLTRSLEELGTRQAEAFRQLQERVAAELGGLRHDTEAKLETIRATVDEKLHATLEARLGQSFRLVSERLEQVHKGLGEMQTLASGVGDLKRVLTNVRSRGLFGEVQLEALLEQVLVSDQYDKNVATVPGSRERVEFAIRLPGRDGDGAPVHLPLDAKFPQEDYLRLQEAYEAGDAAAVEGARRNLRARMVAEASTIRTKYLSPPHTTDFALLFVPTEGLYAEALRLPGLVEELQRRHRVVLVGPTTLFAVLNSLQMGFRTLAIERRSSEVWKVLGAVKAEFGKFGQSLAEVKKKLHEASNKLEFSERRSRAVERRLRDVETLPVGDSDPPLPDPGGEES